MAMKARPKIALLYDAGAAFMIDAGGDSSSSSFQYELEEIS